MSSFLIAEKGRGFYLSVIILTFADRANRPVTNANHIGDIAIDIDFVGKLGVEGAVAIAVYARAGIGVIHRVIHSITG